MKRRCTSGRVAIIGKQIARPLVQFVRLSSGPSDPIEIPSLEALDPSTRPAVVLCWASEVDQVAIRCREVLPDTKMIAWLPDADPKIFEIASHHPRIAAVIGWSPGDALPALWELGLALRRLTSEDEALGTSLVWSGFGGTWYPRSTQDLFATLDEVSEVLNRARLNARVTRRVVGVAHEMLMNALYDAPADDGVPRFAHDRTQQISLDVADAPIFELRTDGLTLRLQVTDPFGLLRREHVYGSLVRGNRSRHASSSDEVIDTSGGGAGLGLHRIISEANSTVFDVVAGRTTRVISTFNLSQSNRERRRHPTSLLFFERRD